jgi:asparagine synthase (glutamine-hydrolysing)
LAPQRGQHEALQYVRIAGRVARQANRVMARAGVPLAVPYLDDRVIEACLAVRMHERSTPWRHKPLLAEVMRDIVPDALARLGLMQAEALPAICLGLHPSTSALIGLDFRPGLRGLAAHS